MFKARHKRAQDRIKDLEAQLDTSQAECLDVRQEAARHLQAYQKAQQNEDQLRQQVDHLIRHLGYDGHCLHPYKKGDKVRMERDYLYVYQNGIWCPINQHSENEVSPIDHDQQFPLLFPRVGERRRRGRFMQVYDVHRGWVFEGLTTRHVWTIADKEALDDLTQARLGDFVLNLSVIDQHVDRCFIKTEMGWESVIERQREMDELNNHD